MRTETKIKGSSGSGNIGAKQRFWTMFKTIIAFLLFILYMIPFLLVLINSLKQKITIIKTPLTLFDEAGPQFENYVSAFNKMGYFQAFKNSLIITVISIVLLIICSSMCAYILTRRNYLACKISYFLLISYMIIPFQVIMIPVLAIFGSQFHLLNNRLILIIMNVAYGTCFASFLMCGFIRSSVPIALEEAALIDGAGIFTIYSRIVLPLLKPILATNMILQTLGLWNDYLLPSLVLGKEALQTLPIRIRAFNGTFTSDYGLMMAALVMCLSPILILFLFMQKYIVGGIVSGAVKE